MNPYYRQCLIIVRLVGACFLLVSFLNLAAYWVKSHHDGTPIGPGRCAYLSIPLVVGVVILVRSSAWARRLAEYLDD